MFRTAELDMSAGCVTEKVFTLCSFPVMVAVVQQSVGKMGRCSLDDRIRRCTGQGRHKWRRRSAEGGGDLVGTRPLCSLGDPDAKAATCGTEEARKRRARRTPVGGLAVIRTRWQRVVAILGVDITNLKRRERKGGATGGGWRGRLVVLDTFDQSSA